MWKSLQDLLATKAIIQKGGRLPFLFYIAIPLQFVVFVLVPAGLLWSTVQIAIDHETRALLVQGVMLSLGL